MNTAMTKAMTKCKFTVKNSSLKCWFSPIFVPDTKTISVYNFIALLKKQIGYNE